MKRVLVTGAGGFIGAHVLEGILHDTDWEIIATDSFRHKGKTDRIRQVLDTGPAGWRPRVTVVTHDLATPFSSQLCHRIGAVDYVIAMASESHVGRSISDPVPFIQNNVNVILSTLEFCRHAQPQAAIVISTDEVYGPVRGEKPHEEWDTILPSNPYSASKAAQEAIAVAYWRTYGVPLSIVNCMNLIGERQDTEKFVPLLIQRISRGEQVPVQALHGVVGTRHYLHARNLADALLFILRTLPPAMFPGHGKGGPSRPERYNITGPDRISNLELAEMVAAIVGKRLRYELVDVHTTRPGHDPHYGLSGAKLAAAGWKAPVPFAESLERTVRWTLQHPEWMED